MGRAEELFERVAAGGEATIDEMIATRTSEELFLDFKRSSDNGGGRRLSDIDRNNLAKAISGFGNSEGGIIIWGVDCSKDPLGSDVARLKVPVTDPTRFRSWLEGAVSGCTIPPHQGVRHMAIPSPAEAPGYVVSLVPQSNAAPHQVVGKLAYYMRAGSDFVPVPHALLAGMFGRRPQPHVFHTYSIGPAKITGSRIHCQVGIMIRNEGPGIARDIFVNVLVASAPGPNCELKFDRPDANNWAGVWSFGRHISLICRPDFRLPPEAHVQPIVLDIDVAPPFNDRIEIEGMVGSSGGVPQRFRLFSAASDIEALYTRLITRPGHGEGASEDSKSFAAKLLGMSERERTSRA